MFTLANSLFLLAILLLLGVVAFFLKNKNTTRSFHPSVNLDFLIKEIKIYIKNTYPNILIDYQKIEKIKTKNQLLAEDLLIVEDIIHKITNKQIPINILSQYKLDSCSFVLF